MMMGKRSPRETDLEEAEFLKNIRDRHDGDSTSESLDENAKSTEDHDLASSGDEGSHNHLLNLPPEELQRRKIEIARLYPWVDRLIEESDACWLDPNDEKFTDEVKQLLHLVASSMVVKKTCAVPLPSIGNEEFVAGLKVALKKKIVKRKDQMLRMVYGGLIKALFKRAAANKGRYPRKLSFLGKYGADQPSKLEFHIETCRTPSKKKLIDFFLAYPRVYEEAVELVETGDCLRASLSKQKRRMEIIVTTFLTAQAQGAGDLQFLKRQMKETLAHLPWSTKEITTSIEDMNRVFKDVEIWKKIEKNQKPEHEPKELEIMK